MKIYHYSRLDSWSDIKRGSWKSRDIPGLGASLRMGKEDKEAFDTGAVFGLLEPEPLSWVENTDFSDTWGYLKAQVGSLLLEVEVDPEDENVCVVDWAHREGILWDDKEGIPEKYIHKTRADSERAYMESKIPLKDYLEKADELGYSLPEIAITADVPLEKVRVSEQQPFIEGELAMCKGELRENLIWQIGEISELDHWFANYLRENELREGRGEGGLRNA